MAQLDSEQFGKMIMEAAEAFGEAASSLASRIHPAAMTEGFILAAGFNCASTGRYFKVSDEDTRKRAVSVLTQGLNSGFSADDQMNKNIPNVERPA